MKSPKILIIKIKKLILPTLFFLFPIFLLIFSSKNIPAIKSSLSLWATSVIPSLFPFFVATELLLHTNILNYLEKFFSKIMKPVFNINGKSSFAFLMGILSGYPIGAKIACEFRNQNICTKSECERLLSFTNNSGPLFIIGTVGISMFGNTLIGILLFITHFLSSVTVGFLFRFWKSNDNLKSSNSKNMYSTKKVNTTFSNFGEILAESIKSATSTILMIGGFIVIFTCIISILNSAGIFNLSKLLLTPFFSIFNINTDFIIPLLTGLLEITNGINLISAIKIKEISVSIVFTAFLLGCGGISILLQVLSIVSKTDLSIKPYIFGKLLHGILAAIYTFLLMQIFPFFNLNL